MPRYFIEVTYKGTNYSGFQKQQNANSIQAEVEKAFKIFFRQSFELTGASRTDAGVHALQNFFHFDIDIHLLKSLNAAKDSLPDKEDLNGTVYNLNAILPPGIVIKKIFRVKDNAHCRFDAIEREYKYFIYKKKDPFIKETAYYFPFSIDFEKLLAAANILSSYEDFSSFSKKNTQVKNFICTIYKSEWTVEDNFVIYHVIANRFLRGMVKGLVGTMLRVGTKKITLIQFRNIVESQDFSRVDFSPPSCGLFLTSIKYRSDL